MQRREFLTASLLATAAACTSPQTSQPPKRPNILFVIADDQSWRDAGAYGAKHVSTPAFDRVAREGILFNNSFCVSPSCTPSRSGVLTGRHVWQQGEMGVLYGAIPADTPLYPHLLAQAGYATGYTGKGWAPGDWKALGLTSYPCGKEYNAIKHAEPVRTGIEPADYAANFRQFLTEKSKDAPFCFWFGSKEPHRIYDQGSGLKLGKKLEDAQVPPYLPDTPEVRSDLLDYYLEIEWYNQQLAKALKILEETNQLDDTLIVVTSDNGMPFPRAKVNLYDAGVHMPLAIRWGKKLKAGRVVDDFVSHTDFAPTFLEVAGVALPAGMAGKSLVPLLLNDSPDPARDHVYTSMERHTMCRPDGAGYPMRALRTKDYLYIRNYAPDRWPTGGDFISSNRTTHGDIDGGPTKDVVVKQNTALCLAKRPAEELYALANDPFQIKNVAADPAHAAALKDLGAKLTAYLKETGDPRQSGEDPWQQYAYRQTAGYGSSFNKLLPESVREAARNKPQHKPE